MIRYVADRLGHDRRYSMDDTKISEELGWSPSVTFDEGLAATVDWYRANGGWWAPLRDIQAPSQTASHHPTH